VLLARWHRVTRRFADDGSCRPVWLAMKQAAAADQVEVLGPAPGDAVPFGLRVTVHAPARGPRRAVVISESLIDGIIAAFHVGASAAGAMAVAPALAPRLPRHDGDRDRGAGGHALARAAVCRLRPRDQGSYVQMNPGDQRCQAGQVTIGPGAEGPFMQISGELSLCAGKDLDETAAATQPRDWTHNADLGCRALLEEPLICTARWRGLRAVVVAHNRAVWLRD
jgi:hypothetical protein